MPDTSPFDWLHRQKRDDKKDKEDNKANRKSDSGKKNEKLQSIREAPTKKKPPLPRASAMQPNMGNVLSDLKRATSARFLSQNTGSPALSGEGKGPPKATPRYPDDEASRSTTYSDERSETSSQNHAPFQQMPRQQPVQSLANNGVAEAQAKAKEVATEKAEEQERKNSKEDTKVKKVGFFNFIWG